MIRRCVFPSWKYGSRSSVSITTNNSHNKSVSNVCLQCFSQCLSKRRNSTRRESICGITLMSVRTFGLGTGTERWWWSWWWCNTARKQIGGDKQRIQGRASLLVHCGWAAENRKQGKDRADCPSMQVTQCSLKRELSEVSSREHSTGASMCMHCLTQSRRNAFAGKGLRRHRQHVLKLQSQQIALTMV
jgi:hypothetical protein